jgi:transcriptional regulator with XRE-family HTH domain
MEAPTKLKATKTSKSVKVRPFAEVQEEIFREFPRTKELWTKTEPRREVSLMLTRLRKEQGLSQKEIAGRAGWDKAFVSRLESGLSGFPDSDTVARYAAACGLSAGFVIGEESGAKHMRVRGAVTLRADSGQPQPHSFERLRDRRLELNAEEEETDAEAREQ